MPERDRLGLDQAGHGQSIKAAVLVRGVDALDQFAPAEDRLAFPGLHSGAPARHRLGLFRPLVVTAHMGMFEVKGSGLCRANSIAS